MTDPIADMLTRIRNAQAVDKTEVTLPYSKMKHQLADILLAEGYVKSVNVLKNERFPVLQIELKYLNKRPAIQVIKRISTPGRRVYVGFKKLPYVFDNLGLAIISTSRGLMTNTQARTEKIGGEVICEIF
ncbi:MAG: 30S ribosomal protein S8 [Candidatus Kerfeldbacteria bacterium]|nr:30S ribosomal protein S8 [Candidatus Kerfeldbacteria bacterium]